MSESPGPVPPGTQISLYDHALHLHHLTPDSPLPRNGEPYPDHDDHGNGRREQSSDSRRAGMAAAAILDAHFARPDAPPSELAWAFHDVDVPIVRDDHIAAAALRADRERVHETGRWLVRYSPDRCSVLIGLALLAMDRGEDDIELIQIVGLLSDTFGWLAADALKRRFGGEALVWLAERISGSSRIQVVETLCLPGSSASRSWLLRRSCQRDFYDAYYAGTVATTAHLHEAIIADDVDDELVDHTGRLLLSMAGASGMGMTWESYPPIRIVLDAYIRQLARRTPSAERYLNAARLLDNLVTHEPDGFSFTTEQRDDVVNRYLWMLHRPNWTEAVRAGIDPNDVHLTRFVRTVAPRLGLPALIVLDDER